MGDTAVSRRADEKTKMFKIVIFLHQLGRAGRAAEGGGS